MSRFGKSRRVFFIEEPVHHDGETGWVFSEVEENVVRCVPKLPRNLGGSEEALMQHLVEALSEKYECRKAIHWFYTPMMIDWTTKCEAIATVYDCMDELSKFKFAPGGIVDLEQELFGLSDLVFTGGNSLYKAKKDQHRAVYEFPSAIDTAHFRQALFIHDEVPDQSCLGRPRIGYAGVIDERLDLDLVASAAVLRPEWNFIMLGPVVKIDPETLPRHPNIHYLGMKDYRDLPRYFAGWDVGMMPFALNESTEFISPTKTPEYLAAGLPVVSTAITDVIHPYGELGLVEVVNGPTDFVTAADRVMSSNKIERLLKVDMFLSERSWDKTCKEMNRLINGISEKPVRAAKPVAIGRSASLSFAT